MEVKRITTFAHELKLEDKEVGQNPRFLHGLSSWLGDILGDWEEAMNGGERSSGNQKFHFRLTKMFCFLYPSKALSIQLYS